ncbi:hypothetical protein Ancab_006412 [Ancistrocladus abbreviatus]
MCWRMSSEQSSARKLDYGSVTLWAIHMARKQSAILVLRKANQRLAGIWVGEQQLRVNIARKLTSTDRRSSGAHPRTNASHRRATFSYADAVRDNFNEAVPQQHKTHSVPRDQHRPSCSMPDILITPRQDELTWLKDCLNPFSPLNFKFSQDGSCEIGGPTLDPEHPSKTPLSHVVDSHSHVRPENASSHSPAVSLSFVTNTYSQERMSYLATSADAVGSCRAQNPNAKSPLSLLHSHKPIKRLPTDNLTTKRKASTTKRITRNSSRRRRLSSTACKRKVGKPKPSHQNVVPELTGLSISDSDIQNINKVILKQSSVEAKEICELGKKLGASYCGAEEDFIERLSQLEGRDKEVWRKMHIE